MTTLREEVARAITHAMTGGHPSKPKLIDYSAADAVIPIILGRAATVAESIGEQYGEDETGWPDCSETVAAAIRQIGRPE